MSVIILLIIIGILVAGAFLAGFIWAVKSGQYDDTYSPAVRILFDNPDEKKDEEEPEAKSSDSSSDTNDTKTEDHNSLNNQ